MHITEVQHVTTSLIISASCG